MHQMQTRKLIPCIFALLVFAMPAIARATTLTDTPEFTANEIYEMMSTDPVEGAAIGASFGGLGLDNEPHQQLANRTALLNNHRITDEGNISTLQAFVAQFVGSMGPNGYIEIPVADIGKGQIQYVVEWGFYSLEGLPASAIHNVGFSVAFPLAFPHAAELATSTWASNDFTPPGPFQNGMMSLETGALSTSGMTVFTDWDNAASIIMAGAGGSPVGLTGFYWVAIGY
jgi:hypothetical protein